MSTLSDRISARIDPALKQNAVAIFETLGLSEADAIRMFYAQVDLHKGLPFDVKIPNAETMKAMKELESGGGKSFRTSKEFYEDIGI